MKLKVVVFALFGSCLAGGAFSQQPANPPLTAVQTEGRDTFAKSCSICHLPPLYEPPEVKPYGPLLTGYLRNPQMEARARKAINEGTPRMPAFKHYLKPAEVDAIIDYVRTVPVAAAAPTK